VARDKADKCKDGKIADSVLAVFMNEEDLTDELKGINERMIPLDLMKKYIRLANDEIKDVYLSKEAANVVKDYYLKMRLQNTRRVEFDEDAPIPIDVRSLDGIVRLCTARAKMSFRNEILASDVFEILELINYSMKQVGWDEINKVFDVNKIKAGKSKAFAMKMKKILGFVKNMQEETGGWCKPNDVVERALFDSISEEDTKRALRLLKEESQIEANKYGNYRIKEKI
jgi:DNA replicative helicase MCM subunit Mcm2 (Cdc46/Mcm family)